MRSYPTLDIANMTLDAAKAIYKVDYWDKVCGDLLPGPFARIAFDCAVNQGVSFAKRTLQTALDVPVDGIIGRFTVAAAQRCSNNPLPVVAEFAARRAVRYAQADMANFGPGWMRRLFHVAFLAADLKV
jgi:lysozyme family protein